MSNKPTGSEKIDERQAHAPRDAGTTGQSGAGQAGSTKNLNPSKQGPSSASELPMKEQEQTQRTGKSDNPGRPSQPYRPDSGQKPGHRIAPAKGSGIPAGDVADPLNDEVPGLPPQDIGDPVSHSANDGTERREPDDI